jgi:hypothetical protein
VPWRLASPIGHQRWHKPAEAIGDPGLLHGLPDIPALLPQGDGDGEQAAPSEPTGSGLDAMADPPVNHRLAQCPLCGVVGGLDPGTMSKEDRSGR